MRPIGHAMLA